VGLIPASDNFVTALSEWTRRHNALLVFDEVITFRTGYGGAQEHYGVMPDLTTLGKVIGGGMPVGAFGGRKDIMQHIAPVGPVYQAGTLSGNPIAMSAGIKTLELLSAPGFHKTLHEKTGKLLSGLQQAADKNGIPFCSAHAGGMFGFFFTEAEKVTGFDDVMACNAEHFKLFFHAMLNAGIYLAPSAFEAGFSSSAHSDEDIAATIAAADNAFSSIASA
jgi:glutamate-1-semialdehyde 2,1-aminomutase